MLLRTISLLTLVLCGVILFENVQGQRDPPIDANDYKSAITTDSINTDDANDYNEEYSKMFNSLKRLDEIMKIFELAKE
ncbi:unnamed protein product [Heterobilharzia americana]|nr:unnamed protein product [Heterobilharzia americana]